MTTIGDIFDIPTQVHQGDFVLRLTEGITRPADTLRTYVVTPQLVGCFDQACYKKKQGYHGGATPQEVLVPLAVLVPQHRTLAGWEALPDYEPAWWSQRELPGTEVLSMPARTSRRARPATAAQGTLFADME